ncbi:MAG: hypothetical protein K8L99_30730, partial [Anaerolineae bacterium]|nr:hypothetical protein [Anaerolineae bacterium]
MKYYRLLPIHLGILATFLLIPVWYRLPQRPVFFPALYVSSFLILLPVLWTIGWWMILRLPGFNQLLRDPARRIWALALLLLVLWAFTSQWWAYRRYDNPEVGATAALQLGIVALFALVMACASPPRRLLIWMLIIGLAWNSILAVLQVANQGSIGLQALGEFRLDVDQTGISVVQAEGVRWLRPYALLPHPNVLAGFLVIGVLATSAWILRERRWLFGTLLAGLGLWALLLTFSRSAWIALV